MKTDPHHQMLNWARWAASGDSTHDLSAKISSLWRSWLPSKHRDPGWGDPAAPDAMPDPIDEQAAVLCDCALRHVAVQHYASLRRHYYGHHRVDSLTLNAALRAFEDVLGKKTLDRRAGTLENRGQGSLAPKSCESR